MRKPRVQSPLDTQPLHVKQALMAWLTTGGPHGQGVSYREASARLAAEYGVRASCTALHHFFRRHTGAATKVARAVELTVPADAEAVSITITLRIQQRVTNEKDPEENGI